MLALNLSNVESLILLCCRNALLDKPICIDNLLEEELNWGHVLKISRAHGISGLINTALSQSYRKTHIPCNIMKKIEADYRSTVLRNIYFLQEFNKITAAFNNKSIKIIPLKGILFLQTLYAHNIGLRPLSDIDILVEKKQIPCAEQILFSLGYSKKKESRQTRGRYFHSVFSRRQGGMHIVVELHWDIDFSDSSFKICIDDFWARCEAVPHGKLTFYKLCLEDALVLNCFHILREIEYNPQIILPLKNFCDIAQLLHRHSEQIKWEVLVRRAVDYNISRPVFLVLLLVKELFNVAVSDEVTAALGKSGSHEQIAVKVVREYIFHNRLGNVHLPSWLIAFKAEKYFIKKWALLFRLPGLILLRFQVNYFGVSHVSFSKAVFITTRHYIKKIFATFRIYLFLPQKAEAIKGALVKAKHETDEIKDWISGKL